MPLLLFSENGRTGAALFRCLSQASWYATLLPAFYSTNSSFSSNTEHLLQVGNSHLKHLYLVPMKQEWLSHFHHPVRCQQWLREFFKISSGILCPGATLLLVSTKRSAATGDEKNTFPARSRNFLCTAHARQGGKKRLANGGVCIFVTFAQSITFVQRVYRAAFAEKPNHCRIIRLGKSNLC